MKNPAQLADGPRFLVAIAAATLFGAAMGAASAQDHPPGQLDSACASQCLANGNEAAFCEQVR